MSETKINDGGPAFPEAIAVSPAGDVYPGMGGMSRRDWLAGQALAGMLANSGGPIQANSYSGWQYCNCGPSDVARVAYELADAMIAAREGRAS